MEITNKFKITEYKHQPSIDAFKSKYSLSLYQFLEEAANLAVYEKTKNVKNGWYPDFLVYSGEIEQRYSMQKFSKGLKDAAESRFLFPTLLKSGNSRISEYFFVNKIKFDKWKL